MEDGKSVQKFCTYIFISNRYASISHTSHSFILITNHHTTLHIFKKKKSHHIIEQTNNPNIYNRPFLSHNYKDVGKTKICEQCYTALPSCWLLCIWWHRLQTRIHSRNIMLYLHVYNWQVNIKNNIYTIFFTLETEFRKVRRQKKIAWQCQQRHSATYARKKMEARKHDNQVQYANRKAMSGNEKTINIIRFIFRGCYPTLLCTNEHCLSILWLFNFFNWETMW